MRRTLVALLLLLLPLSGAISPAAAEDPPQLPFTWGLDEDGQLGDGISGGNSPYPALAVSDDEAKLLDAVVAVSAGGAHTLEEWVSIEDLVRVAKVYALTALGFCGAG